MGFRRDEEGIRGHMNQEALVAAKWWADRIRDPDAGPAYSYQKPYYIKPTPEQVNAFEHRLADIIQTTMIDTDRSGAPIDKTLSVDYNACAELNRAMSEAGMVDDGIEILPLKTVMILRPGSVTVSCGYGAHFEEILP